MEFSPTFTSPLVAILSISNYIISIVCLYAAFKKNLFFFASILAAVIFGFLVEYTAMSRVPQPYHYDQYFILIAGKVPLGICVGWAATFYAVITTVKLLNLPKFMQPFISAVLAVSIDIVLDPIAVQMNMWTWTEKTNWFGIPWSNYIGWFIIVFSLTSMFALADNIYKKWENKFSSILLPLLSILPAFLIYGGVINGYVALITKSPSLEPLYVSILVIIAIILFILIVPHMSHNSKVDKLALMLPLFSFGYGLISFFTVPMYSYNELLAVITPVFTVIGISLFLLPYKDRIIKRKVK